MVSAEDRGKEASARGEGYKEDRYIGRSVTQIGNSKGVTIPANWLERLGIDADGAIDLAANFDDDEITLKFRD